MNFYHGSSIKGLKGLLPYVSEHKKSYIYFAQNPVVALFYTVKAVEKPYSWFPYGFNKDGVPVYTEYYPNACADVYKGKKSYIYLCQNLKNVQNPTNINGAYVSEEPVAVVGCTEIDNVYEKMLEYEKDGLLIIKSFQSLTEAQKQNLENIIVDEIRQMKLKEKSENSYSRFLKSRIPKAWEKA